jgi:N-acetylglucosamine PTS system EIICBA or EIICB component
VFAYLQRIGRALMLPIAVLPAAGLALRLGQADSWNIPWLAQAGAGVFDNLPILFAVGVAAGFTADVGTAAVAAFVGYAMFNATGKAFAAFIWPDDAADQLFNTGVLGGILFGIIGAELYNRFHAVKLPEFLAFFGGRRFVPIVTAFTAVIVGLIFGALWHFPQSWLHTFATNIADTGAGGAAAHAFLNRLLIPLGLHHVINTVVWFQTPGDLNHFFCISQFAPTAAASLDPTCVPGKNGGQFMTGFFPIMMFGLPAAALAMVMTARNENRRAIAGIMFSAALTSFVTGVTEPIEFAFMFVAPVLYVLHAALTAVSAFVTVALGMRDGFTFSAGVIDFFINRDIATNPLGILGIGVIFAVIYFVVFYFTIKWLDIPTPGREPELVDEEAAG